MVEDPRNQGEGVTVADADKGLDFLVIGAMRSGTTTLYELMRQHHEIALPPGKEVPFFSDDTFAKGMDWYLDQNFDAAGPDQRWGTVTPQYMFREGFDTATTARRIREALPDVRLVAILRHPIERSYSHYKWSRRRSYDDRSFVEAVRPLVDMDQGTLARLIAGREQRYSYLERSRYATQLRPYYELFDRGQILVLFTDELEDDPTGTLARIYRFIGVDDAQVPADAGSRFHQGGTRARIPWLTPGRLRRVEPLLKVYRRVVPYRLRKRFEIWLHVWNTKPDDDALDSRSEVYRSLVEFFREDVAQLEAMTNRRPPWPDWTSSPVTR